MTYPTTPQKKDRARGRAGKGGQAVVLHHDFDAILKAAAAEEGNLLRRNPEIAGEGRAVDSMMNSTRGFTDNDSRGASSAAKRQAAMEWGGSGQQKRKKGVAERVQSGAGAEGVQIRVQIRSVSSALSWCCMGASPVCCKRFCRRSEHEKVLSLAQQ